MLELKNVTVDIGKFVLKDISFRVNKNDVIVVLGPSGSGKTSLLKTILGIHTVKKGEIIYDEKNITELPINKRKIAYVPQKPTLYPHMTVEENIDYGLRINKVPKEEREKRIADILAFMGISDLKSRLPKKLSGGEAQRVSIARALVLDFPLILLDEPFTGIDNQKAKKIRRLLKESVKVYNKTLIYVTHHVEEAAELGNKIVILNNGVLARFATPEELINNPQSKFVADFLSFENIYKGVVKREKSALMFVPHSQHITGTKNVSIFLSNDADIDDDEDVTIAIRPEHIILSTKKVVHTSARNCLEGEIVEIQTSLIGSTVKIIVDCGIKLAVIITRNSLNQLNIKKHDKVFVMFKATAISILSK